MENASKALIIAGAILISILLIGIGIMVMNSINAPLDQAADEATAQAIRMFNDKFSSYSGQQTAASVKSLMTAIQASNGANSLNRISASNGAFTNNIGNSILAANSNNGGLGDYGQISQIQSNVYNQKQYRVTFTYGDGTTHPVSCTCTDARVHQGYIISVNVNEI